MSRAIPGPPSKTAKKKMPPPPKPNLGMQLVEVSIDEPEQERPQKLLPPEQIAPSNLQPVVAVQEAAVEQKEQSSYQVHFVPPIKKGPLKKPAAPPKVKKPIPPPAFNPIIFEQTDVHAEQPPKELVDMTKEQLRPKEVEQPILIDAQITQPIIKDAEIVRKDEPLEVKLQVREETVNKFEEEVIEIETQFYSKPPPAPPSKTAKKGRAPPPPTKPKIVPNSPKQAPINVQQKTIPQTTFVPQPPKPVQKVIQPPIPKKSEAKVEENTAKVEQPYAQIREQVKLAPPPPSAAKIIKKQPPKPPISAPITASGGKSSMSAKLQELRRAKQQMLNDQSQEEQPEQEQQEQKNYESSDFVKEEPQHEPLPIKIQTTPTLQIVPEPTQSKKDLPSVAELTIKQKKTALESALQLAVNVSAFAQPKTAMRAPAVPSKRMIPPPAVKNLPKVAQSKVESEPVEPKQVVQDVKLLKIQEIDVPKVIQVAKQEQVPYNNEPKPNPTVIVQQKVKIVVKSSEQKQQTAELNALLQRYHSLKSGYISNLRQLDELIHFQKQQEDSEIEKISHLLADLHRRNQAIKQICSIKELPSPDPEVAI